MAKISTELRAKVTKAAQNRCGYCLSLQDIMPIPLEIEHIIPSAKNGTDDEDNLWLACRVCNNFKKDKIEAVDPETKMLVPLFNPLNQNWFEHFQWTEDSLRIIGISSIGRATATLLHLSDNELFINARKIWKLAGWQAPSE
jgi:hypothetical protein